MLYLPIAIVMSTAQAWAVEPEPARLELINDGLGVVSNVATRPDDRDRLYVLEKDTGKVRTVEKGALLEQSFLDIGDRLIEEPMHEEGLLGLAFPPDFARAPRVYVTYIDRERRLVLSVIRVDEQADQALTSSERVLLKIERSARMHHCGHITFGHKADALYLCIGDNQENEDVDTVSQDLGTWKGKLVRIPLDELAVDGGAANSGPKTSGALDGEIVAYGLRNPWRFAFDPRTGDLFVPDAGRNDVEEINFLPHDAEPANFGWPFAEGNRCTGRHMSEAGQAVEPPWISVVGTGTCEGLALSWPVVEYLRDEESCAVIGGEVYDGSRQPEWNGVFVFSDLCNGKIWALRDAGSEPSLRLLVDSDLSPHAIGKDTAGEIIIAHGPGAVYRLSFPKDFELGWRSVDEVLFEMMLSQRREGTGSLKKTLDRILNSQRWQLANKLSSWYRKVSGWF